MKTTKYQKILGYAGLIGKLGAFIFSVISLGKMFNKLRKGNKNEKLA